MQEIYYYLSKGEAIPVIGPLLVSPIRLLTSTLQIGASFVGLIPDLLEGIIDGYTTDNSFTRQALKNIQVGTESLGESLANIATLGIVSILRQRMQSDKPQQKCHIRFVSFLERGTDQVN